MHVKHLAQCLMVSIVTDTKKSGDRLSCLGKLMTSFPGGVQVTYRKGPTASGLTFHHLEHQILEHQRSTPGCYLQKYLLHSEESRIS